MIAFFNNAIVIGFAGFIADYIRKRYQQHKQTQEKQDEFLERILLIEHEIISSHKKRASIIIDADYNASASNTNNINE